MALIIPDVDGYVIGPSETLPGVAAWYTAADATAQQRVAAAWKDAPLTNVEVLGMLLEVAQEQVLEYAPAQEAGAPVPSRFVWAQIQHAKHLWNAGRVDGGGNAGSGEFTFAPRPLDKDIQNVIRPRKGVPSVF